MRSSQNKVKMFNVLRNVNQFWRIVADSQKFKQMLPRVYFSWTDCLPAAKDGTVLVNINKIIKTMGKGSGLVASLKEIIDESRWHLAWLELLAQPYGWYIIQNILWKKR